MLSKFDKKDMTILEIGSKEVVGESVLKKKIKRIPRYCEYQNQGLKHKIHRQLFDTKPL